MPERGVGVDQPGPTPRTPRLRRTARDGLELEDVAVELDTPVADAGRPRAHRVAVGGSAPPRSRRPPDRDPGWSRMTVRSPIATPARAPPRAACRVDRPRQATAPSRPDGRCRHDGRSLGSQALRVPRWVGRAAARRLTASYPTGRTRPVCMWLFTTDGFYSAVTHREAPDTVVVRARARDDVLRLIEAVGRAPSPRHPSRLPLPRLPAPRRGPHTSPRPPRPSTTPTSRPQSPNARAQIAPTCTEPFGGHVRLPAAPPLDRS